MKNIFITWQASCICFTSQGFLEILEISLSVIPHWFIGGLNLRSLLNVRAT